MCNSINCSHGDDDFLNDSLDGLFEGEAQPLQPSTAPFETKGDLINAPIRATVETRAAAHGHRYEEKCEKCRGTGRWVSYSGLTRGECFACKGKGVLTFKSSPEARAKARDAADRKREEKAQTARRGVDNFIAEHPAEWNWLNDAAKREFEFAVSVLESLHKYGALSPKQFDAVARATAKSEARKAEWAAERAAREANKAEVQIDRIAEAFRTAKSNLIKFPKLRLAGFIFSLAGENSRNAGAIYVKTDSDVYLGKVVEGRFTRSRDCTAELEQGIVAAAADPEAAASAYGLQTGICSCCGRELTNAESVGLGIGPICRGKWGW